MWYVLTGPDTVLRDERLATMRAIFASANADAATFNMISVDSQTPIHELGAACESAGFFAEKRMVIARYWLSKADAGRRRGKGDDDHVARLISFLPDLGEMTDLVFVEDDELPATHALVKFSATQKSGNFIRHPLPPAPEPWIQARMAAKGGAITPAAAQRLATRINRGNKLDRDHFAEDTRLYLRKLENEIEKLLAFANGRSVEVADVDLLTAEEEVADIFKFVDHIGQRRTAEAFGVLRGVLARGESPLVVLTMLANHYRLLIVAHENQRSSPEQLAERLGLHPFPVKKAMEQARRAQPQELEAGLRAVLQADEAIKTGAMEDVVALDVLISELGT